MTLREEILKNSGLLTEWNAYSGYSNDNKYEVIFTNKGADKFYDIDDSDGIANVTISASSKKEANYFLKNYWKEVKQRIIDDWNDSLDNSNKELEGRLDDIQLSDVKLR